MIENTVSFCGGGELANVSKAVDDLFQCLSAGPIFQMATRSVGDGSLPSGADVQLDCSLLVPLRWPNPRTLLQVQAAGEDRREDCGTVR